MLAVAKILVVDADRRFRRHDPATLLDDGALERRLLPLVAYDLLEVVAVQDAAHHVLGAGFRSTLEQGDLQSRFGHGNRSRSAGWARPDNHRVELFVVGH